MIMTVLTSSPLVICFCSSIGALRFAWLGLAWLGHPIALTMRPRNIHHRLNANFPDDMRLFQAVLLFLLIANWADAGVGMFRVAAEIIDILLLSRVVTHNDSAVRHG